MITLEMVRQARKTIAPFVHRTPTEASETLTTLLGIRVSLKLELFQKTGSFKPRGAFNQLLGLTAEERSHGVVAVSGGNFAQGVAYAGRVLEVRTRIIMPEGTPINYLEATRGYGAEVELATTIAEAFARAEGYQQQGWSAVHPYDDERMMAGDGTIGLELLEEVPDMTDLVVSIGGGGLITGVAVAVTSLRPQVRVWGVETIGADAMTRALAAGKVVEIKPTSLAKTLGAPNVAEDALRVARERLAEVLVVSDQEAYQALELLLERAKVLPELAASATLAAARRLQGRFEADTHLVLLLCGGNVSLADLCGYRARFGAAS